jgi:hypothetical protein
VFKHKGGKMGKDKKKDNPDGETEIASADFFATDSGLYEVSTDADGKPYQNTTKPPDAKSEEGRRVAELDTEPVDRVDDEFLEDSLGDAVTRDDTPVPAIVAPDLRIKTGTEIKRADTDREFAGDAEVPAYTHDEQTVMYDLFRRHLKLPDQEGALSKEEMLSIAEGRGIEKPTYQNLRRVYQRVRDKRVLPGAKDISELSDDLEDKVRDNTEPGVGGPESDIYNAVQDMDRVFDDGDKKE